LGARKSFQRDGDPMDQKPLADDRGKQPKEGMGGLEKRVVKNMKGGNLMGAMGPRWRRCLEIEANVPGAQKGLDRGTGGSGTGEKKETLSRQGRRGGGTAFSEGTSPAKKGEGVGGPLQERERNSRGKGCSSRGEKESAEKTFTGLVEGGGEQRTPKQQEQLEKGETAPLRADKGGTTGNMKRMNDLCRHSKREGN